MKNKNIKSGLLFTVIIMLYAGVYNASAQGMAINSTGAAANSSAMLDVQSTTQGMLVPRMTAAQRTSISTPAQGLLVYDITLGTFYFNAGTPSLPLWTAIGGIPAGTTAGEMLYWNGSAWTSIATGADGQVLTLNAGVPTWTAPPYNSISANSGAGGTVSPAGVTTVFTNSSQVYSITPATGYATSSVTVDGTSVGAVTNYTFSAVAVSHTINATFAAVTYSVGVSYEGGIIAYILQSGDPGYSATITHGLIAAVSDQSSAAVWGCSGTTTGATGTAIGTGAANTTTILGVCTTTGIAAQLCRAYTGGGYTDWYLPSQNELYQLYNNRSAIGGFGSYFYWSSSEYDSNDGDVTGFFYSFLRTGTYAAKAATAAVRAVRSF